tara:strand:- start:57358 stop:58707 length:1350 start_codon:yes stop_codon:yes gene_type:complete
MTQSPTDLSIFDVGKLLRSGALTSLELTQAYLERIASRNPAIGAFVYVDRDRALAAARSADTAFADGVDLGPLHGIPFAIKDIMDVAGWPVRWGSRAYGRRIATGTAGSVQSMLDAGAVPLGLVATYELATVGPDTTSLYPQPRNPLSPDHITGGSSSGSAAAVASGMVRIALGTDTGGSIRIPAAYCGVAGLKPTYGAVSLDGVMVLAPSLDHVGPIARTVAEARAAFAVLSGRPSRALHPGAKGVRIGHLRGWCGDEMTHPSPCGLLEEASTVLRKLGGHVADATLPDYAPVEALAMKIILAEDYKSHGAAIKSDPNAFGTMATQSILSGERITTDELFQARAEGQAFGAQLDALLAKHDVLMLPTTLAPPPLLSDFADGVVPKVQVRTLPFNVTGHPALSVPMGSLDGLPMGLQIIGRLGQDETVLRVGETLEAGIDFSGDAGYHS